jgi:hypothetical protein
MNSKRARAFRQRVKKEMQDNKKPVESILYVHSKKYFVIWQGLRRLYQNAKKQYNKTHRQIPLYYKKAM